MIVKVDIALTGGAVGNVGFQTDTAKDVVTIRIGDVTATVDREAFRDAVHRLGGDRPKFDALGVLPTVAR